MRAPSAGSRLLLSHLGKAAQHLAGISSSHVSRQSTYLTAGSHFSVSTLSAARQFARRCRQANPDALELDVEKLRIFSLSVLKQAQTSQGRGFAAQAVKQPGAACSSKTRSSPVLRLRPSDRCIL